jgi:hypothetical protein
MRLACASSSVGKYSAIEPLKNSFTKKLGGGVEDSFGTCSFIEGKVKGIALFSSSVFSKFIFLAIIS